MPMPPRYEIVPDKELVQALEHALQAPAGAVTREGSCFLASIGVSHIVNCLAAADFIVVRPNEQRWRLDV
jgi:hypothetical protein